MYSSLKSLTLLKVELSTETHINIPFVKFSNVPKAVTNKHSSFSSSTKQVCNVQIQI